MRVTTSYRLSPIMLCVAAIVVTLIAVYLPARAQETSIVKDCDENNLYCMVDKMSVGEDALRTLPTIAAGTQAASKVVTYSIETRGAITASLAEFKSQASLTLYDDRGWARLGVTFQEVTSGGDFTLVLAEASQVPSFSSIGCDSTYSCSVGRFVIINQDRWLQATPAWNAARNDLRDYRHMAVNHEIGHWLGHGHKSCRGAGQAAALMQQQSVGLQGCTFNQWPLESELYAPRLGL